MSQVKEISLPVPWGHVSAKAWGFSENFPVLCVHGILDNAGAFDRLISLLPKHYYYIAVDLPGHGFSSHLPTGIQLNFFDYLLTLRYIVNEFRWKNFIYVGHSLGGQLGTFYSLTYPNEITKLVLIEGIAPKIFCEDELIPQIRRIHDSSIKVQGYDMHKNQFYTCEEIIHALQFNRSSCLNRGAAEALFKRSVTQIGGLFQYNRDARLKTNLSPLFNLDQMIYMLSKLNVRVLFFLSRGSFRFLSDQRDSHDLTELPKYFGLLKVIYTDGNHDVHNNYPERISNDVSEFLDEVHTIRRMMENVKDISIKVPWGHVAGKVWGAENHDRVLVVHGVLDNAGSFDRLIALLPQNSQYICIDLPGHGLSSHFDHGTTLNYLNYILTIRYVLDELKWNNVCYMGHSFGAHLGSLFTIIYPNRIKKLILIDGIIPRWLENESLIDKIQQDQDLAIKGLKKNNQHFYTKAQIMYALKNLRKCALNSSAADAVFVRSVTQVEHDLYYYNRDFRARFGIFPHFSREQNLYLLRHLKAETLVIFVTDTLPFVSEIRGQVKQILSDLDNVQIIEVKGNHDVHNNYPERISNYISNFLIHKPSKL